MSHFESAGPPSNGPYHENLYESSQTIEHLAHSLAFERMMHDHAKEVVASAQFERLDIDRDNLPTSITDAVYLPRRLAMSNVSATYTRLFDRAAPDEPPVGQEWLLALAFEYADNKAQLVSNGQQTTLTTQNHQGDLISYPFPGIDGPRFLISLAAAELGSKDAGAFIGELPDDTVTSPAMLTHALEVLGNRLGSFKKSTLADLPHPEFGNRHLLVTANEIETPGASSQNIELYLACELAPDKTTVMESFQSEIVQPQVLEARYGKRYPADIAPDQLFYAIQLGMIDDRGGTYLSPDTNREQYDLVSSSMMSVLAPYLQPYSERYDTVDITDVNP